MKVKCDKKSNFPILKNYISNQSMLSVYSAPIQLKRWSIEEIEHMLRAKLLHLQNTNGTQVQLNAIEEAFTYLDTEPNRAMTLLGITGTIHTPADTQADRAFRAQKRQYLNPAALRANMGGISLNNGGEAHHVIPSCVAEKYGFDGNELNKAWNGIVLPGCMPDGEDEEINPMYLGTYSLPYHRPPTGAFDHAKYNIYVDQKVQEQDVADATIAKLKQLADKLKNNIVGLGKGGHLDQLG